MKLFYIALMAMSLCGCAVTNTKENPDICQQSADTIRRKFNRTTEIDKEVINVETSEKIEFYESTPLKVFSGIESAHLNKSSLNLTITDKGLFEQYSAPAIKPMIKAQYEAHPFTGTFTPVGIFVWLFNPTMMNAFTFGCTETTFLSPEPDKTRKVKTGKSEWKAIQKSHRILVSGFVKEYEVDVDSNISKVIDLSSAIASTELTENTILRITCLDCNLPGPQEQNYKDSKTNIVLTHDFRPIKKSMAESQGELVEEVSNLQPPTTVDARATEQTTQAKPYAVNSSEQPKPNKSSSDEYDEVKYTKSGGTYSIPALINEVLLINFVIDTGASDVMISLDVYLTLLKTGTIKKRDRLPSGHYQIADGSIVKSDRFIIRPLKIGSRILKNVTCSISDSIDADMLLGQSALEQLGNFTFHYETGTVRFKK